MVQGNVKVQLIIALLAVFGQSVTAQDLLFSDTFSIRQGERPPSWAAIKAPTLRYWSIDDAQLASGPGQDLGGDGYSYAVLGVGGAENWGDYGVSAQFWMPSRSGRAVLVGRWRDARNHYQAYFQVFRGTRSVFLDVLRDGVRKNLAYGVGGVGLDLPSIEGGSADRRHSMQLRFVGASIAFYLDGKRVLQAIDDAFQRGTAGVGVQYATVYFDNIIVETAQAQAATVEVFREVGPDAVGAKQVYRLLMGTFAAPSEAEGLKGELIEGGFLNVTVEPAGANWDVLAGAFLSDIEAQQERVNLTKQGVRVQNIVVRAAGTTQFAAIARERAVTARKAYSLVLGRFPTQREAQELKGRLELDGFFGSQIRAVGQQYVLALGSFRSREDADKYRQLVEGERYKVLEVIEEDVGATAGPVLITPKDMTAAVRSSDLWRSLTAEQREQLEKLLASQATTAGDLTQFYRDLRKEIEGLRLETSKRLSAIDEGLTGREMRQRQAAALIGKANQAVAEGRYDEARGTLKQVLEIDSENLMVEMIRQQIDLREKTLGERISQALSAAEKQRLVQTLAQARDRAARFEQDRYYQNALLEHEVILGLIEQHGGQIADPVDAASLQQQSREKINWLKGQIAAGQSATDVAIAALRTDMTGLSGQVRGVRDDQTTLSGRHESTARLVLVLMIGFGVLALLFLWIFWSVRRRSRLLLEQMRSLTLKPMMEIAGGGQASGGLPPRRRAEALGGGGATAIEEPPAASPLLEPEPFAPEPEPAGAAEPKARGAPVSFPEDEVISSLMVPPEAELQPEAEAELPPFGEEEPVGAAAPPAPSAPVVEEMPLDEEALFGPPPEAIEEPVGAAAPAVTSEEEALFGLGEEPRAPVPAGKMTPGEVEPETGPLHLEDFVIDGGGGAAAPPSASPSEGPEPSIPLDLDLMGVGGETAPSASSLASGVFHEQSFEDEVVGTMPQGWAGAEAHYEFASLKVVDDHPGPQSQRCLRFEKVEGVGSAYFSCRFPDATGQVSIEFDLRCDRKNKFLLGFYVEKDGDFRQSIHTIVHQPDEGKEASLRLQGEAVPYEMGSWRRVKYVVNLSAGRLTGYVDGQMVLDNIRLTNCPRSLNTLSIRDNIPTTGVLLIDTIRVTRGS